MAFCGIELPQIPTPQEFKDPETLEHRLLTQKRAFLLTSPSSTLLHICPCWVGTISPFPPTPVPSLIMVMSSPSPLRTAYPHTKHVVRHLEFTALTNTLLIGPTSSLRRILNTNAQTQVRICRVELSVSTPSTSLHPSSDACPYFSNLRFNWYKCESLSFSYSPTKALFGRRGVKEVGFIPTYSNLPGFKSSTQFLVV